MRTILRGYYRPTLNEYARLWHEGTFVFDTNALLALYEYPPESRETFHSILETLGKRIWIPYHVALEFQRNRVARISDVRKVLRDTSTAISQSRALPGVVQHLQLDKRGIDAKRLADIWQALNTALMNVEILIRNTESTFPSSSLNDEIRDRLSGIFEGKIGAPPEGQKALDALLSDATERFKAKTPPGYKDASKPDTFLHKGVRYENKYGDLIIWRQLLEHLATAKLKYVVFVTGDQKEDWWLAERGETLGPRPELVQEALDIVGAGAFWMYSTEQFFKFAQDYLKTPVTQEAIDQVAAVAARSGWTNRIGVLSDEVDDASTSYLLAGRMSMLASGNPDDEDLYHRTTRETNQRVRSVVYAPFRSWLRSIYPDATLEADEKTGFLMLLTEQIRWAVELRLEPVEGLLVEEWVWRFREGVRGMAKNRYTHYSFVMVGAPEIFQSQYGSETFRQLQNSIENAAASVIHASVEQGIFTVRAVAGHPPIPGM